MEIISVNAIGRVRRVTINGREHLVAPMVLITPGVLNGSKGSLYYPPDEIARDPSSWNGMPIVLNHPHTNGQHISGRSPEVWEKQLLGHVFNVTTDRAGRLKGEGWFDVENTRRVSAYVLDSLQNGRPIELSTGLFTINEPAEAGATYNGKPYQYVARDYRPDHLAILPDQQGACSLQDGCGVLVNAEGKTVLSTEGWQTLVCNNEVTPIMALTQEQRQEVIRHLTTNCDCWKHSGDAEVLNRFTDEKLVSLKDHAIKEAQAIVVANAAVNGFTDGDNAYRVNPETGKWERKVVANQPFKKKDDEDEDEEEEDEEGGKKKKKAYEENMEGEDEEEVEKKNKKRMAGKEKATENRSTVRKAQTTEEYIKQAPVHIREQLENTHRYAQQVVNREQDALISKILANVAESDRQSYGDWLKGQNLEFLQNMLGIVSRSVAENQGAGKRQNTSRRQVQNTEEENDALDIPIINWQEVGDENSGSKKHIATANTSADDGFIDANDEELLQQLPPRLRNKVLNANAIEEQKRREIIDDMTANMGDEESEQVRKALSDMPLKKLQVLQTLPQKQKEPVRPNYFGASVPSLNNFRGADATEEALGIPTINWQEEMKQRRA